MDSFNELTELISRASALPPGKTTIGMWSQAIDLAEEQNDVSAQMQSYLGLINAVVFAGESPSALAPFLRVRQLREEHPEVFDEYALHHLCWAYKYVIGDCSAIPTISVDQWKMLLDDMRRDYLSVGDGLSAYHYRMYRFYDTLGLDEQADEAFGAWLAAPRTELSDCEQCEPEHRVCYLAAQNKWEDAVALGEKTLATTEEFCDSQPESLLSEMLIPWLQVGRDDKAWPAHVRAYARHQSNVRHLSDLHLHLRYLAACAQAGRPERKERALSILLRHLPWWAEVETPGTLMHIAATAVTVLDTFTGEDLDRELPVTLPGDRLTWHEAPVIVNPTIAQMRQWCFDIAHAVSERFAARPGHPHPDKQREYLTTLLTIDQVPPLEEVGDIPDVTGIFEPWKPQTTLATNLPGPGDTAAADQSAPTAAQPAGDPEDEPLPPLTLDGPWRSMSVAELRRHASSHPGEITNIYGLFAAEHRLAHTDNPHLPFLPWALTDEHSEHHGAEDWGPDGVRTTDPTRAQDEQLPVSSDVDEGGPYALLLQAFAAINNNQLIECATLADRAMRTAADEPLSVRLNGLRLMGISAFKAGYHQEAIASMRELVNLAAALGLRALQLDAASGLANYLGQAGRYLEASEVAQTALEVLSSYNDNVDIELSLHTILASVLAELEDHASAAVHFQRIADISGENGEELTQIHSLTSAMVSYSQGEKHREARAASSELVSLARAQFTAAKDSYYAADPEPSEEQDVNYRRAVMAFAKALYGASKVLAQSPGELDAQAVALMEERMNELYQLFGDPQFLAAGKNSQAWYQADWLDDLATLYWFAEHPRLALDTADRAIEAFCQGGYVGEQAATMARQAQMYTSMGDMIRGREILSAAIELLEDAGPAHSRARQMYLDMFEVLFDDMD